LEIAEPELKTRLGSSPSLYYHLFFELFWAIYALLLSLLELSCAFFLAFIHISQRIEDSLDRSRRSELCVYRG